jgi:hypothetical protein
MTALSVPSQSDWLMRKKHRSPVRYVLYNHVIRANKTEIWFTVVQKRKIM